MCLFSFKRWEGCGCVAEDLWSDCHRVMAGRSCLTTRTGQPTQTLEGPSYKQIGTDGRWLYDCIHCRNAQREARHRARRRGGL